MIKKSFSAIGLILFFAVFFAAEAKAEAPAPTLIAPGPTAATAKLKPLIIGLSQSGSLVKIFIDDVYNGKTKVLDHPSGTANFAYQPFLNLSRGWHNVYAIAEDGPGGDSLKSEVLRFKIELPMPAPTIFKPVVNQNSSANRPFIVGLAKNNSKIKVYIDKKYQGEFTVKNHPSGTANFAYRPAVALARGSHLIYAVAVDKRGKESGWSNLINFASKNSAIAQSAQDEQTQAVAKLDESNVTAKVRDEAPVIFENPNEKKQTILSQIKDFLATGTAEKIKIGQGMINEGRGNQSKLKLSLLLFVLFFVGVVAWLLWVNRELIKERRARDQGKEEDKKDKLL